MSEEKQQYTTEEPAAQAVVKRRSAEKAFKSSGLDDFMAYVQSPWRIIWSNLLVGIFRGLGVAIGATAVLALLVWLLSLAGSFPLIGQYARELNDQIAQYAEDTRYSDDFQRLEVLLKRIEENTEATKPGAQ
ncbi:DUF5665 domain-containing protein [Granulosicoccaceae sp. 1_MG-2023]|nr:DUF5665 domain-containing protein [Granulosicoccaceae sp. 1_MG-2023]